MYLEAIGARQRVYSPTLQIASFELPTSPSGKLRSLDRLFIPVAKGKTYKTKITKIPDYGDNEFIFHVLGVDKLHKGGYYGQGITIGVFDTGFDSTHPAILPIFREGRVIAAYDFNSGDHLLFNNESLQISDSLIYINRVVLRDSFLILSFAPVSRLALNDNAYSLMIVAPHFRTIISQNERAIEPDAVLKSDTLFVVAEVVDRGIFQIKLFKVSKEGRIDEKLLTRSISHKFYPSIWRVKDTVLVSFIDEDVGVRRITLVDTQIVKDDTFFIKGFLTYHRMVGDYLVYTTPDTVYLAILDGDSINNVFATEGFYPAFDAAKKRLYFSTPSGFFYYDLNQNALFPLSPHILTSLPDVNEEGTVFVTMDDYSAYRVEGGRFFKIAQGIFDQVSVSGNMFALRQRGDGDVQPDTKDPYNMHGTEMLSIIGGFWEGKTVGIAPMANFVLCKTERGYTQQGDTFENPIEEDFWVEALEFAHFYGARVISSSLGYKSWYTNAQLDGKYPVSSRMASRALKMGMVVVNAMGNAYHDSIPQDGDTSLVAPADAYDIIATGGCDTTGTKPAICSYGPAGDGRVKPEIVAPFNAYYTDSSGVTYWLGGTSVSTAIVSGIIAAAWSALPELSARMMRENVLNSAVELPGYPSPNNITGYGRIDAGELLKALGVKESVSKDVVFLSPYPNPVTKSIRMIHLPVKFAHRGDGVVKIYTVNGEPVATLHFSNRGPGIIDLTLPVSHLSPGLYVALCHTGFGTAKTRFVILPR